LMSKLKKPLGVSVLEAARQRISYTFDHFERVYISFSGGKDSSVVTHMVMEEAIKRGRSVGWLIIDLEAQYRHTIDHIERMIDKYERHIELHWVALPINLRNAVTNFSPQWQCWSPGDERLWVRQPSARAVTDPSAYPFFVPGMEFEEFVPLWGMWYANGHRTAAFVGIRADESLNRFRTIVQQDKAMFNGQRWTTHMGENLYNVYPIYDWRTADVWRFHGKYPHLDHNRIYDMMNQAGVPLSQQRLCQPYGDDQRRGLWLYHILEPDTWFRLLARVNGVNSGALYVQERGNVSGYQTITKPDGHTWKSFTNLLLRSLPKPTREHYIARFRSFIRGWEGRGYVGGIPDEAPKVLEDKHWVPSWRRLAKVLLRNDWWCKGLGLTQPKSEAYAKYQQIKKLRKHGEAA